MTLLLQKAEDARVAGELEAGRMAEQETVRFGVQEADRIVAREVDKLVEQQAPAVAGQKAPAVAEQEAPAVVQQDDGLAVVNDGAGGLVAQVEAADMRAVEDKYSGVEQNLLSKENIPASMVNIKDPSDIVLSPAKLAKDDFGSAIPTSCESLLGSSPELPHKEAGFSKVSSQTAEKVGEDFSQPPWGSSISPQESSGRHQDSSLEENMQY